MNRLGFVFVFGLFVTLVTGSSHSEAPFTARTPASDITDFYIFRSYETGRTNFTTIILNVQGFQNPYGGPNYYSLSDQHFYEIHIDTTGDAVEDITFQFLYGTSLGGPLVNRTLTPGEFDCNPPNPEPTVLVNGGLTVPVGGKNIPVALKFLGPVTATDQSALNWFESYSINYITGAGPNNVSRPVTVHGTNQTTFTKPFDYAGTKAFPDYEAYANQYIYQIDIPDCSTPGRVFVGQRRDSFSVNLGPIFDLINFVPIPGFPGAIDQSHFNDAALFHNIDSFILEVPTECIVPAANQGVIGAWGSVRELTHGPSGFGHIPLSQTNRLANPLVNELMIGLIDKNYWDTEPPSNDIPNGFNTYIEYPSFAEIISILFLDTVNSVLKVNLTNLAPTNFPRNDLVAVFLTGIPGLNQPKVSNQVQGDLLRYNSSIPAKPARLQNPLGVIAGDAAGYPNGRRPGDDVIDITLQVAMGKLCTIAVPLFCTPAQAPIGNVPLTDGSPVSALKFNSFFPYLQTPLAGAGGSTPRQRGRAGANGRRR
jgi:hypothetical protein